ncbi:MAG: GAF domain-containing protein [Cytophagales bacterium]
MSQLIVLLQKYIINILLSVVVFLMLLSCFLVFYNKKIVDDSTQTQKLASSVAFEVSSNHANVIRYADVSIRGFAILREERMLFIKPDDLKKMMETTFYRLDSILQKQGYNDPEGIKPVREYQEYIRMLVADHAIMAEYLKAGQDSLFMNLFRQDKSQGIVPLVEAVEKSIVSYENQLRKDAELRTVAAMKSNIYIQLFMVLLGVPAMVVLFIKLNGDESTRKKILAELEENNRKFLFNPGSDFQSDNASAIIQNSIDNFEQAALFVTKISKGDFNVDWEGVNDSNRSKNVDNLAGKLIKLREDLKSIKIEDEKRFWLNEGLTKFSILVRNNQDSLENLSLEVVKFLTKYLSAQQGSLFITKEESKETYLELTACYALDRKKFVEKKIEMGEGLVGQTYLEKQTIVLTDVPQGYVHITSGLGGATPNCIVVIPFKYNDKVEAVFEIAGFWVLETYKIEFLEKAGEFVASALTSVKTSEKMKVLLEETKKQSEEMRATEEELRQNMEEMQSTQEEMQRVLKEKSV